PWPDPGPPCCGPPWCRGPGCAFCEVVPPDAPGPSFAAAITGPAARVPPITTAPATAMASLALRFMALLLGSPVAEPFRPGDPTVVPGAADGLAAIWRRYGDGDRGAGAAKWGREGRSAL